MADKLTQGIFPKTHLDPECSDYDAQYIKLYSDYIHSIETLRKKHIELIRKELSRIGIVDEQTKVRDFFTGKTGILKINGWSYDHEAPFTASIAFVPLKKDGTLSDTHKNVFGFTAEDISRIYKPVEEADV